MVKRDLHLKTYYMIFLYKLIASWLIFEKFRQLQFRNCVARKKAEKCGLRFCKHTLKSRISILGAPKKFYVT